MSDDAGSSRIISPLNNGRSPMKKSGDLVTRKEVEQFLEQFANNVLLPKVDEICQHYAMQMPGLVAKMLGDAMAAQGKELEPPPVIEATQPVRAADFDLPEHV